jgi:hypothetical protein
LQLHGETPFPIGGVAPPGGTYSLNLANIVTLSPATTYYYRVLAAPTVFPPVDVYVVDPPVAYGPIQSFKTASQPVENVELKNWVLSGSLHISRLNQDLTLPEGSSFNGTASINLETQSGPVSGTITVPPFNATVKILGLPATLGLEFSQVGSIEGSIAPSTTIPGDFNLSLPAKANIGLSSITVFGLKIPTKCVTSEPLSFNLLDTLPLEGLVSEGANFMGTTKFPTAKCEGSLGSLEAAVLNALLVGPDNPFSITIHPPA